MILWMMAIHVSLEIQIIEDFLDSPFHLLMNVVINPINMIQVILLGRLF